MVIHEDGEYEFSQKGSGRDFFFLLYLFYIILKMLNHGNGFHIQKINEKFKEKQGVMLLLFMPVRAMVQCWKEVFVSVVFCEMLFS